jgi:hypothetical protein
LKKILIGVDKLLYYGSKDSPEITINLEFDSYYYEIKLQPAPDKCTLMVASERVAFRDGELFEEPSWKIISNSVEESRLFEEAKVSEGAKSVLYGLKSWRVYHFFDTSENADKPIFW